MEKKVSEKVVVRRKSDPDYDLKLQRKLPSFLLNSTSNSSDSSCNGGFSSSEAESVHGSRSKSSCLSSQRPKHVRTNVSDRSEQQSFQYDQKQRKSEGFDAQNHHYFHHQERNLPQQKQKHESKTKLRALKIYRDMKKVKQPISPGGRLSSFLNSLFSAVNSKKPKMSSSSSIEGANSYDKKSKSSQASVCSSASSFSRSCLSKTPSSRGKLSNGNKRSVRFYPVSVIVDEDSRPCGHKCLYQDDPSLMEIKTVRNIITSPLLNEDLKFHLTEKNRRIEETTRNILKGFQKKKDFDMRDICHEDDDEDDTASYSSSDLFELDNLSAIGIERYQEELPVYETTHFNTNRAIADGLIL